MNRKTIVKQLKADGYTEYQRMKDAVYMSKGADHRVILADGTVKRGKPGHRRATA